MPIHLPANVVWLIGEDVLRLLDGKGHRPGESITSVADCHLEVGSGAVQYRFAGAISVKQLTRFMRATSN